MAAPERAPSPALEYAIFDCDNHYYEALDAFSRHVDRALGARGVQWCEIDGRKHHVVGGRVSGAVRNATFSPISKPGCLYDFLRGNPKGENPLARLRDSEPIPDHYRHPDARLIAGEPWPSQGGCPALVKLSDRPSVFHTAGGPAIPR